MNVAGPSRPRPVPGLRERDNYEEDLTRMIAQLELDDVERLQTLYDNRVHRGEGLTDREVAFALLMQNVRELAEFNADRALAQQLQEGDEEPDPAPMPATVALQRAVAPQPTIRNITPKTQTWGQWFASIFSAPVSNGQTPPNPAQAPTIVPRPAPPRATGHDCVICQDPIFGAEVQAPCGHFYDIGCITDLFQSATRDESLYPPRCCRQDITLQQVRPHLTLGVLAQFELKAQEFGTMKRIYCIAPTCSRFLGPLHEGYFSKVFTCPSPTCTMRTCGKCRSRHEGSTHICTPDADAEQVLALSRTSGWARCPGCAQMIELETGCFHMTCRCRTEFCYLCKELWKNCGCPQWDEDRLLAAAEHRVDAQLPLAQPANPFQQAPAVRQPVPALGDVRNQPVNLPGPAPAPVAYIRPENPFQQVPAPALRAAPIADIWEPAARRDEANARVLEWFTDESEVPEWLTSESEVPEWEESEVPEWDESGVPEWDESEAPEWLTSDSEVPEWLADELEVAEWLTSESEVPEWEESEVPEWHARVEPASTATSPGSDWNAVRQRMVREIMERLRVDHDCEHKNWTFRSGGGRCEACEMHLPLHLFRCSGCEMLACNRCRRNRL